MSFADMKLGRISVPLPPNVPRLDGHKFMAMAAPPKLIRDHVAFRPTVGGNDACGDCTAVAVANTIHAQAALAGWDVAISDEQCVELYAAVSGYSPSKPDSDVGAAEVSVLSYQAMNGFETTSDQYVGLWATLPTGDLNALRLVTAHMGTGYLGLLLAEADQQGDVWDTVTPASDGDPTPGSWGAHAAILWDYDGTDDTSLVTIATWGLLQKATIRWLRSRLEEAHALWHPQMLDPTGRNPAGLNRDRLAADVAAFGATA